MTAPTEAEAAEAQRRWAIRMVLIEYDLHVRERMATRPDPNVFPSIHDIADLAIKRLDRLYSGEVTPEDLMAECEETQWD